MRTRWMNVAVGMGIAVLGWGCLSVDGTMRVEHVYEGEPATVAPAPAVTTAPAQPAVATEAAQPVATPPAQRVSDQIRLEVTRDARITHHSSIAHQNHGRAARLRVRDIGRGSSEVVLTDFDRGALRSFVAKYEGQEFSGKLFMVVREEQSGPAAVEICVVDAGADWNEGEGSFDDAKPGEVTANEAQAGREKWRDPDGTEYDQLRHLLYRDGVVEAVLNSQTVTVGSADVGSTVALPLDDAFIRHYATSPHARGLALFTRNPDARIDFYGRLQRNVDGFVLVVETR